MKKKHYLLSAFLPLLLWLLAACSDDQGSQPSPSPVPQGYVALEIIVPGQSDPATRALDAVDECEIQTIDILAFNTATNRYVFHGEGTDIVNAPGAVNGNKKIFYIKIPQDGTYSSIYLMAVANAKTQVAAAISSNAINTTKTQNDVMRTLEFASGGIWPVKPGTFTRFPMWGMSKAIDLTASVVTVDPITLIRAVAKVDVGVNFPANSDVATGLGRVFKIEEVWVYNAGNRLRIAPEPGSYTAVAGTAGVPDYSNPANPPFSVASPPTGMGVNAPMKYEIRAYNANKFDHMNEIYVAEHAAGSVAGRNNNFCIVIGARFGTAAAEGTTVTYYRVDFIKTDRDGSGEVVAQNFLPILRNHRYKVNIKEVHGKGYNTHADAFQSMGMNTSLTVDIVDTDEQLTEFEYDGQYALGVSKGAFILDKNAHANVELEVGTTNELGWTATSNSSWLTFTAGTNSRPSAGKSTLKFNTTANPGAQRVGKITINSGRLTKEIEVTQRNIGFIETNHLSQYIMDITKTQTFTVKSTYDWHVRVKDDPKNIIRTFTPSGTANVSGTAFNFTLENDYVYQTIMEASATLTFYSLTGEFVDHDVVINGKANYNLANLWVRGYDQPLSQTWYVYSNTPIGVNENSVPPTSGQQSNPAQTNSCAAIKPNIPGKPWRLPTQAELVSIYNAAVAGGGVLNYGFANNVYYWSASTVSTTVNAYAQRVSFTDGHQHNNAKSYTGHRARCVRSK